VAPRGKKSSVPIFKINGDGGLFIFKEYSEFLKNRVEEMVNIR